MALARDFRELDVYRRSIQSAGQIFPLTRGFPKEERYAITDQVRRSSRSVCANIAEAWRKRQYPKSFLSKLSDADAESAETVVWLDFALDCGYIEPETHDTMCKDYQHTMAQLTKKMNNPDLWCNTRNAPTKRND